MEVTAAATAAYEAALPGDARVESKRMFGAPCAFVNRQMFFGTFEDTIVARVGPSRAAALVGQPGMRAFTPMENRPWADYIQVDASSGAELLSGLAQEALTWTLSLPAKAKKPKPAKRVKKVKA